MTFAMPSCAMSGAYCCSCKWQFSLQWDGTFIYKLKSSYLDQNTALTLLLASMMVMLMTFLTDI